MEYPYPYNEEAPPMYESALTELLAEGVAEDVRPTLKKWIKSPSALVEAYERLSPALAKRPASAALLTRLASSSLAVFDEVHTVYNPSNKASAARQFSLLCPTFILMTATPRGGRGALLQLDWLRDSVSWPVDKRNWLVAAAQMHSTRVELPIQRVELEVRANLSSEEAAEHLRLLRARDVAAAMRLCLRAAQAAFVSEALRLAAEDRPGGGVLVVCADAEHLARTRADLAARLGEAAVAPRLEATEATAAVLVTRFDVTGYTLVRLGAICTQVYPSSAASRHQLRGRIRRIGQTREEVLYSTVFPENSILALLHETHSNVDRVNANLEALAEKFVG